MRQSVLQVFQVTDIAPLIGGADWYGPIGTYQICEIDCFGAQTCVGDWCVNRYDRARAVGRHDKIDECIYEVGWDWQTRTGVPVRPCQ